MPATYEPKYLSVDFETARQQANGYATLLKVGTALLVRSAGNGGHNSPPREQDTVSQALTREHLKAVRELGQRQDVLLLHTELECIMMVFPEDLLFDLWREQPAMFSDTGTASTPWTWPEVQERRRKLLNQTTPSLDFDPATIAKRCRQSVSKITMASPPNDPWYQQQRRGRRARY